MKKTKIVAVIMAFVMAMAIAAVPSVSVEAAAKSGGKAKTVSVAGTAKVTSKKSNTKVITNDGGWQIAENNTVTKARKKVFNKAIKKLTGVKYTPIAYLKSQVVAGYNHCYLCKAKTVTPNGKTYFAAVYIYESPKGAAKITKITKIKY